MVSVFEGGEGFSSFGDELRPEDELASAAGEVVSADVSDGTDASASVVAAAALLTAAAGATLLAAAASPLVEDELPVSS